MKTAAIAVLATTLALALQTNAQADMAVLKSDKAELSVGGLLQLMALGQHLDDPVRAHDRLYLFVKEGRFRVSGKYEDYKFNLQMALGPEDVVAAPSPGVAIGLLDLSFEIPLHFLTPTSYIKIGQFKVPYGRERLTYSGYSLFVERSVQDLGFRVGRDVGAAVTLNLGPLTAIGGVFTGGGRDAPQRFLPERLGVPMVVFRAGYGDVDEDYYALKQTDFEVDRPKFAVFVNGLYTKDTQIGHSTVFNVKLADKSLFLNPNWNPFIGQTPMRLGQWWQVGGDIAARIPAAGFAVSGEAEANYGAYSNSIGIVHLAGGRAHIAVRKDQFEVGVRYGVLFPDAKFAKNNIYILDNQPIQEVTPAIAWYLYRHNLKLVLDVPLIFKAPVALESGIGAYVLTEQPDQTSVLGTGSVVRQNVIEARLMFQGQF